MKVFRHEGGEVKTEEERKAMAEKHRFKKNREFSDIRSFKFHSLERAENKKKFEARHERKERHDDENDRRRMFGGRGKSEGRGGRRQFGDDKRQPHKSGKPYRRKDDE